MEKHPIALENQKFFVPSDAVTGDQIGEVTFLYTFTTFWNEYYGTSYTDNDFSFSLISGTGFAVNSSTGDLSVTSLSGLSGTVNITVRVTIDTMSIDVTCEIVIIDSIDCFYFDPDYDGSNGISIGTRERPFLKFNGSGLTPTAGKMYLWRRGKTFTREWTVIVNPVVGGNYPDWITFDAYGQGARPIINGNDNILGNANKRFVDVGGAGLSNDNLDPTLVGNKFRIANIDTTHDKSNSWYPFQIRGLGDYLEFRRISMEETTFSDGFMYFAVYTSQEYYDRQIYLESIKTKNSEERSIKIEAGGVRGNNFYCINEGPTLTEHPAPGAANWPNVTLKYIYASGDNISTSNLGLQCRSGFHTYEFCYLKGFGNTLVVYIHLALDGKGGIYDVKNGGFKNIIVDGAQSTVSYFGRQGGTTGVADGIYFTNIKAINCSDGMQVAEGAINTLINYCDISGTGNDGIRIFSAAGSGTKIHNVTAFDNNSNDIELSLGGVELINSNYGSIGGTPTGSNNSNSQIEGDLINAGIYLDYTHDSINNPVPPEFPSIGAYEFTTEQTLTVTVDPVASGTTNVTSVTHGEDEVINLVATPADGFGFVNWTIDSVEIDDNDSFAYTAPFSNQNITANFSATDTYTLTLTSGGNGTVSGGGSYDEGEIVVLTAVPSVGYDFSGWFLDGSTLISSSNPYSYTMPGENVSIEGQFTETPPDPPTPEPETGKRCETWLNGFFFEYICGSQENKTNMIRGLQYYTVTDLESEPVTLTFFKNHLRVDFDTDDLLLTNYLKSARMDLEKYSQLSFGEKRIKVMALEMPKNFRLMHGPVQSIIDDKYTLFGDIVTDANGNNIEFEFMTGWVPELPEPIKIAICQYGAGLYINRENILSGISANTYIDQAKRTLDHYKNNFVV